MKSIRTIFAAILFLVLFSYQSLASTVIDAQVVRNQQGSGECLISSGFPLPKGLVTEQMIRDGIVRVKVDGKEVAANVSALRGRHHDGTLRSMLIQFQYFMDKKEALPAQVIIDDGGRPYVDADYQRPTLETVRNNNVIFPVDPEYLVSTNLYMRSLLPAGQGSRSEERFFTELAEERFDYLMRIDSWASVYEPGSACIGLWCRTGNLKYWNGALHVAMHYLDYFTPAPGSGPMSEIANPDSRETSHSRDYVPMTENAMHMMFSYAQMYLLTGYRDFWGIVAANWANQQQYIASQSDAFNNVLAVNQNDHPRFNYANRYGILNPAFLIDATPGKDLQGWMGSHWRKDDWAQQAKWIINALLETKWNLMWIPFENGSGPMPEFTIVRQGEVEAKTQRIYKQKYDPPAGGDMPETGYIQISASTLKEGSFQAGSLEFPDHPEAKATATGQEEDDYRNGMVGTRHWTARNEPNPVFQFAVFPVNFMIDYYLNIEADPRIPEIIKKHTDVTIMQVRDIQRNDTAYGSYGHWGRTTHTAPYDFRNPVRQDRANPWMLPVFSRMLVFTLKTHGVDEVVNGKTYTEWYEVFINPANVSPRGNLNWQWRHFGQMYGWQQDAPWMMTQESLLGYGPSEMREPTVYDQIPGDVPDISRENHLH